MNTKVNVIMKMNLMLEAIPFCQCRGRWKPCNEVEPNIEYSNQYFTYEHSFMDDIMDTIMYETISMRQCISATISSKPDLLLENGQL